MRKTIYVDNQTTWDEVKEKSAAMDLSVSAYLLGGSHISSSTVSIESLSSRLDRIEGKLGALLIESHDISKRVEHIPMTRDLTGENLDVALFEASHSDSEYIKESAKLREELMKLPLEPGGVLEVDSEECDIIEAARDSARAQLDAERAKRKVKKEKIASVRDNGKFFNPQPKGKKGK